MKNNLKAFVALMAVTSALSATSHAETCLAQKIANVSYGSEMHYRVMCEKRTFETKKNITTFLIPLPYNWGAVARKNLKNEMVKQNLVEVGTIAQSPSIKGDQGTILIYETKEPAKKSKPAFCLSYQFNARSSGIDAKQTLSDVFLQCTDGTEESYSAVSKDDVERHLAKSGYSRLFQTRVKSASGMLNRTWIMFDQVVVYRKN